VRRARGVVADFTILRKPGGGYVTVQVLGFDPAGGVLLPWAMERGLPADLHGPRRVAVDVVDLDKLALAGDPLGATLMLRDTPVVVAALSRRIRSFTLAPYVFAELPVARELLGVADGAATYWVLDLEDPACAPGVLGALSSEPELDALTTDAFIARTREHWVGSSGIGTVLALGALLSLIVGIVIMGQTLHAITKDHLRELATLKALGATAGELARFVAWQAAALAAIGGVLAALGAFGVQGTLATTGLTVVLGPAELAAGAAAIAVMCAAASVASVRAVLRLEPIEVLR
jgi:putative ABC transport system permease protein